MRISRTLPAIMDSVWAGTSWERYWRSSASTSLMVIACPSTSARVSAEVPAGPNTFGTSVITMDAATRKRMQPMIQRKAFP